MPLLILTLIPQSLPFTAMTRWMMRPANQEKNPLKHDSFLLHNITAIRGSEINY